MNSVASCPLRIIFPVVESHESGGFGVLLLLGGLRPVPQCTKILSHPGFGNTFFADFTWKEFELLLVFLVSVRSRLPDSGVEMSDALVSCCLFARLERPAVRGKWTVQSFLDRLELLERNGWFLMIIAPDC